MCHSVRMAVGLRMSPLACTLFLGLKQSELFTTEREREREFKTLNHSFTKGYGVSDEEMHIGTVECLIFMRTSLREFHKAP